MRYLLGGLVIAFMLFMLVGGLTGRLRAKSCCVAPMTSALGNEELPKR